ncbi:MAG TPA: hypothetical protein VLO11_04105, partial [Luteolibacter sp.]|nr:hypothetical protein [Luteolibacter sp.]
GNSVRSESLRVRYSYNVNGKVYRGRRISFGSPDRLENSEIEFSENHRIWYCPLVPRIAVLIPGVRTSAILFSSVGLFFLLPIISKMIGR